MRTTNIRFTGLASGLDTESIVKSMIAPYQMKVDSKWQSQTLMEMQKEAWRGMNKQIFSFYDKYVGGMRLESTFNKKNISVSNPNVVTIDKNSNLPTGTHKIEGIHQLAEGATVATGVIEGLDINKKFSEQDKFKDLVGKKISINNTEITITDKHTVTSLAKEMQEKVSELNITFDSKAKAFFISSKKTGESQTINLGGDTSVWDALGVKLNSDNIKEATFISFEIDSKEVDGKTVEILKDDLILDFCGKKIEYKSGSNIENIAKSLEKELNPVATPPVEPPIQRTEVKYQDGKLTITGGNKTSIKVEGKELISGFTTTGKNAILSYNGVKISSESNNISVNGLKFVINAPTNETITLVSSQDTDAIANFMKEFVDEYNKLIEDIHTKLKATSNKGYAPLTSDQKKEMSEYEIEAWEKKIKDGLFRNDPELKKVTDMMRQTLGASVEGGVFSSLSELGITTGDWKENGKLHFDEDKFREALSTDTDAVIQLIAGSGNTESLYEKERVEGKTGSDLSWEELLKSEKQEDKKIVAEYQNRTKSIGDRLYDTITEATRSTTLRSTYSFYNDKALDKKITAAKEEVSKLEERMYRMENMYYKKFSAMESMMQKLNNQSNWLTSQLGGM